MTTNNGKVISAPVSSSGRATGIHAGSNGKVIEDRARSKPGATGIHAGNNGKVIEDRARSKPGATGIHAGNNILATGVRCGGSSGANDARVGRTRGVSVITDNAFRREHTRRSTLSLTDVLGSKGEMARFASDLNNGVPYENRARVAAVKEKRSIKIQRNFAAWIALLPHFKDSGTLIGLLMDARLPSQTNSLEFAV